MTDAGSTETAASTIVPLDRAKLQRIVEEQPFDLRGASIREMNNLVNAIEAAFGLRFVRM
jgi:hypothetical protein